jgi:hypothetical protein
MFEVKSTMAQLMARITGDILTSRFEGPHPLLILIKQ